MKLEGNKSKQSETSMADKKYNPYFNTPPGAVNR